MKKHDDPDSGATIAFGIVGAVLVFVMIIALQALFYREQGNEIKRKVVAEAPEELSRLSAEQQELLNSYRWVDQKAGVAGIPIERAMELTVRDLARAQRSTLPAGEKTP